MLVVFSLIFVGDTKITFVYNFVAPLKFLLTNVNCIAQNINRALDFYCLKAGKTVYYHCLREKKSSLYDES